MNVPVDRKRKWDGSQNAAEAKKLALEKVAQLNAMYKATEQKATNFFEKEIDINDSAARFTLTKGATQQQIARETRASVISRGMYMPPSAPPPPPNAPANQRRLHIYITAENKQSFDLAVSKITEIMMYSERTSAFSDRVYINLDHISPVILIPKIMGPQGSFTQHIEQTSGAKVEIKGRGAPHAPLTEAEPMHFLIHGNNRDSVTKAAGLARSLLETVSKEFPYYPPPYQQPPTHPSPYPPQPPPYQQPPPPYPPTQPHQPQQPQQPQPPQQYPYPQQYPPQSSPYQQVPPPYPSATAPPIPPPTTPPPPTQPGAQVAPYPPTPQPPLPAPPQQKYSEEQERKYRQMMEELNQS